MRWKGEVYERRENNPIRQGARPLQVRVHIRYTARIARNPVSEPLRRGRNRTTRKLGNCARWGNPTRELNTARKRGEPNPKARRIRMRCKSHPPIAARRAHRWILIRRKWAYPPIATNPGRNAHQIRHDRQDRTTGSRRAPIRLPISK